MVELLSHPNIIVELPKALINQQNNKKNKTQANTNTTETNQHKKKHNNPTKPKQEKHTKSQPYGPLLKQPHSKKRPRGRHGVGFHDGPTGGLVEFWKAWLRSPPNGGGLVRKSMEILLGCPRKLGSMVSKWVVTNL